MNIQDQPQNEARGVSLHRLAYGMDVVSVFLLLLYPFSDTHFGNRQVMGVSFGITILVLLMCLLTLPTVRNRWLPFLLAFILLMVHGMFVPHL